MKNIQEITVRGREKGVSAEKRLRRDNNDLDGKSKPLIPKHLLGSVQENQGLTVTLAFCFVFLFLFFTSILSWSTAWWSKHILISLQAVCSHGSQPFPALVLR